MCDINIKPVGLELSSISDVQYFGNEIYIFGWEYGDFDINPKFKKGVVYRLKDGNSVRLPDFYIDNGEKKYLEVNLHSMTIDKNGNIYIVGNKVYKYTNGEWITIKLNDEYAEQRKYVEVFVDTNDKFWITSQVESENSMRSEILFFDGKICKKIIDIPNYLVFNNTNIMSKRISKLTDGRIVFAGMFPKEPNGANILILDKEHNSEYVSIDSSFEYANQAHKVNSLFIDKNDNIWLSMQKYSWISKDKMEEYVGCGGLYRYSNSSWKYFDEQDGYDYDTTNAGDCYKKSAFEIIDIAGQQYFFVDKKIYQFNKNKDVLKSIKWENIVGTVEVIPSSTYYSDSLNVIPELNALYDNTKNNFIRGIRNTQNNIIFFTQKAIFICNSSFSNIQNNNSIEDELLVYPNPVVDILSLNEVMKEIRIYDINGNLLKEQKNRDNKIALNDLEAKEYFLVAIDMNNQIKFVKFLKK
jgi:hypothetical protein